jgi:hypothetical protein
MDTSVTGQSAIITSRIAPDTVSGDLRCGEVENARDNVLSAILSFPSLTEYWRSLPAG